MSNARLILIALIFASPMFLLLDGPIMHGLVAVIAAAALVIVSRSMRPGETEFLISIIRPFAVIAAVPAVWMLIQVLPLKALAHPIWSSAEIAIGHPIAGSISVDTGASVMALGQYLCIVAVGFLSAAVAVDRQRAESILFSLTGATVAIALIVTAHDLLGFTFLNAGDPQRAQALDCIVLGLIIAGTAGVRTLERYETRQASPERSVPALLRTFAACGAALAICAAALILGASGGMILAAGYGVAALASVIAIRRLGLGRWGIVATAGTAVGIAMLAATDPAVRTNSLALAFATTAPASPTSVSARMLDDAPHTGTGAGTFAAIAQLYRDIDDPAATAPTTAAAIAIELGWPMLWLIAAATAGSIAILLGASLRRGRDSFYPAAGGSCLLALLFLSFMNAGLMGTAAAMIAAATLGLGLAQSKSRTVQS